MTFEEGMKQSIEETEREKCELLGIIQEKGKAIAELVEKKTTLEKRNFELEAQIEKMKCCENCIGFCNSDDVARFCKDNKYKLWEIKEND